MTTDTKSKKQADTTYPIHEILQKRWSPRAFSDKSVDPQLVKQLFEAARWAPSAYNEQPWSFIFARKEDAETFNKLSQVMIEFNQGWAKSAPVLALGLAKMTYDLDGRTNKYAEYDLGQSVAHLTFEATRHDLYVHQMAGFEPEKAEKLFDIPDNYKPKVMFAIGYKGNANSLEGKLKKQETAPRSRKPLDEIILNQ